ncbi:MAG: carbohydrate ABC transporter permease, partial [Propionibacteriaceae bacterium]
MTSEAPSVTEVTSSLSAPTLRAARRRAAGSSRVRPVISQILLSLVALLFLVPIIWMVLSALKPSAEVFTVPPKLFGSEILFSNFAEAWNYLPFGRFILNTIWVAGVGTLITLVASATAGYAFARLNFKFQGGLFILYLSTLIVPQEVIVIPMFLVMQQLGWVNSYKALILPWAFTAFGTFLLRQFFLTIPKELEEAAKIDGCGHIRILRSVIIPVAAPAIAVLAVFTFITYWNSFLWPLIITGSED